VVVKGIEAGVMMSYNYEQFSACNLFVIGHDAIAKIMTAVDTEDVSFQFGVEDRILLSMIITKLE
jgi:hypothetical protein